MKMKHFVQSQSIKKVLSLEILKVLVLVQLKTIFFLFSQNASESGSTKICQSFGFLQSGYMPETETKLAANKITWK